MINPKILVILASYNGSKWIGRQIDSVLQQENVSVHLYISDDGSVDDTINILNEHYGNNSLVTISKNQFNGGSAGLNFISSIRSVDVRGYEYIAYCDQDDIWNLQKLSTAVESMENTQSQGYSSAVLAFWPDGYEKLLSQSISIRKADFLFEGAGQGCTFVIRVEGFKKLQDFCKKNYALIANFHFHDWLTYLLFRIWGFKWFFDQQISLRYRQHSSNDIGARKGSSGIFKRISLIKSGWYRNQLIIAMSIYEAAGGKDDKILNFINKFNSRPSFLKKLSISIFLLAHSRRRLTDRAVLFFAAIFGFI
jgi:rhamnosyltransferase